MKTAEPLDMKRVNRPERLLLFGLFAVILGLGIYARFAELAWHFTNVDDMGIPVVLLHYAKSPEVWTVVSSHYNNAPLQFIFTHLLLDPSQTYREVLFWARLPSCVAGVLGIVAMGCFYYFRDRFKNPAALLGVALVAFSWENIAYAKQAFDYAIGAMATTWILAMLAAAGRQERLSWGMALGSGALLALCSTMQYTALLFIPAFYLAVLVPRVGTPDFRNAFLKCAASAVLFLALVWPVWHFFISTRWTDCVFRHEYATGYNNEYLFTFPDHSSWLGKMEYAVGFYARNLRWIIMSRFGFTPEGGLVYRGLSVLFLVFTATGLLTFLKDRRQVARTAAAFVYFALLIWFGLVGAGRLPFGPTRHTLFFLPVFAVTAAQGFDFLFNTVWAGKAKLQTAGRWLSYGLIVALIGIFAGHYRIFLEERRDPFTEEEIIRILKEYKPGEVFADSRSIGTSLMKKVNDYLDRNQRKDPKERYRTIARFSRYPMNLTPKSCEELRARYNAHFSPADQLSRVTHPCSDYEIVFSKVLKSDVQVNYSRRIKADIFTNSMYIHVVRLKKGVE